MASVTTAPTTRPTSAAPKKKAKPPQPPFRDRWLDKKGWSKRAPLLPAFVFVFLLTQLPFLITLVISLLNWKATRPDLFGFAWFANFVTVFTDPSIRSQLVFTLVLTVTVVLVSLLLGLGIALLLNRSFFGRGAVRTMMIAPFLIVPVAAAQLFRYLMFDVNSGLFNGLLTLVNGPQVDWLTQFPRLAVEFELIWQWTPFMTLILLAGLQSRPGDIMEAASVDGSSGFQTFRYITLPHMRRYLELAGLLGAVYIIQQFDTIYVFGGIGLGAANLPYGVFNTLQNANDYGLASAQGVVVVIGSIVLATLVLRNLSSLFEEGDPVTTALAPSPSKLTNQRRASNARARQQGSRVGSLFAGVGAWIIGLLFISPIVWMLLTSLHSEQDAGSSTPKFFAPLTFDNYTNFFAGGQAIGPILNSVIASFSSTALVILLAIPAAYALSVRPIEKWTDVMFFFLTTKMLPLVAGILPIYLIAKNLNLLDNINLLVVLYTAMNLPIAIWMLRSFLADIPVELFEAAALDGAGLVTTLRSVIVPIISPGIAATALICFIFSWNELFLANRLASGVVARTAPVYLGSFITGEGLFAAKLAAAAVIVSLPVLIAGFAAQDKLVQGLSLGAVK